MLFKLLRLDRLPKSTVRNIGIVLALSNAGIMYHTYATIKRNRPEFRQLDPPTESHRMAIFDNIASTYDATFERPFKVGAAYPAQAYGVDKAKKILLKRAKGHVLDVAAGTLNNLPFYAKLDSLTAIDKSPNMCLEMKRRIGRHAARRRTRKARLSRGRALRRRHRHALRGRELQHCREHARAMLGRGPPGVPGGNRARDEAERKAARARARQNPLLPRQKAHVTSAQRAGNCSSCTQTPRYPGGTATSRTATRCECP